MKSINQNVEYKSNNFMTGVLLVVIYCLALYHYYYYLAVKQIMQWDLELQGRPTKALVEEALKYQRSQDIRTMVLDLSGGGIELLDQAIWWNINSDSFYNAVKWVGQHNGLLVIDKNMNGKVDNHSEVIGGADNSGFIQLADFDKNKDGKIDQDDPQYHQILVWDHKNYIGNDKPRRKKHNLYTLQQAGFKSLNLTSTKVHYDWDIENKGISILEMSRKRDRIKESMVAIEGNAERLDGTITTLADVKLHFDLANTLYAETYTLSPSVRRLPNLRGYGQLMNLHVAMSLDSDINDPDSLMSLVRKTQQISLEDMFVDNNNGFSLSEKVLFRWAGADKIPIPSRGWNANARRIAFIEAFLGEPVRQLAVYPNPRPNGGHGYNQTFLGVFYLLGSRLLVLGNGKELFNEPPHYSLRHDTLSGLRTLNIESLNRLVTVSKDKNSVQDPFKFWSNIIHFVDEVVDIKKLHPKELLKLDKAISQSMPDESLETIYSYIDWEMNADRRQPFERKGRLK